MAALRRGILRPMSGPTSRQVSGPFGVGRSIEPDIEIRVANGKWNGGWSSGRESASLGLGDASQKDAKAAQNAAKIHGPKTPGPVG